MTDVFQNPKIVQRLDQLIEEGERQLWEDKKNRGKILDTARLSQWTTSSLNLLDRLSASTNRFVTEFEHYGRVKDDGGFNIGLALGVLRSARDEYMQGLAVDYQLSVTSAVFGDLLEQARYLESKGYLQAAVVLLGATIENGLRARAKVEPIELSGRETLVPLIHKLKHPEVCVLTEFEAKKLEAYAEIRNHAAHRERFDYGAQEVRRMRKDIEHILERVLGGR